MPGLPHGRPSAPPWLRATALLLTAFALCFHGTLAFETAHKLRHGGLTVLRPWTLQRFSPTVVAIHPFADLEGIYIGDRLLAIDGVPLVNSVVEAEAFQDANPGEVLDVTVNHDPGSDESWVETVPVRLQGPPSSTDPTSLAKASSLITFSAVAWPFWCAMLAAYLLVKRSGERKAWLLTGVLLFSAQLGRASPAHTNLWPDPWRLTAVIYQNIATWSGLVWLVLLILYFPGRLLSPRVSGFVLGVLVPPLSLLTFVHVAGSCGEVISYHSVRWLAPHGLRIHFLSMSLLLIMLTAVIISLKLWRRRLYYTRKQLQAVRLLRLSLLVGFVPWAAYLALVTRWIDPQNPLSLSSGPGLWLFSLSFVVPLTMVYVHCADTILPVPLMFRRWLQSSWILRGPRLALDQILFRRELEKEEDLRKWLASVPQRPRSLEFLVGAGETISKVVGMNLYCVHWREKQVYQPVYLASGVETEEVSADNGLILELRRQLETGEWDPASTFKDGKPDFVQDLDPASPVTQTLGRDGDLLGFLTLSEKTNRKLFTLVDNERLKTIEEALTNAIERYFQWKAAQT